MTLNCSFHASMAVLTFSGRKDWCGYVFHFFVVGGMGKCDKWGGAEGQGMSRWW